MSVEVANGNDSKILFAYLGTCPELRCVPVFAETGFSAQCPVKEFLNN